MSIFFVNTQNAQISNAFIATLGAAPGSTYLAEIKAAGLIPSVQAMITATGSSTAAALSTKVATNLGLTGTAFTGGTAYLGSVTFAGASSTWAANLMSTLDLFTTLQFDAIYGSAATAYLARVNSAVSYSVVATNNSTDLSTLAAAVGSAGSTGSGSTFTLTTSIDNFPGTSGNDTFIGDMTATATLNASDQIAGGAGTDTLKMYGVTAALFLTNTPLTVTGVEKIEIANAVNAGVYNFSSLTKAATGLTTIQFDNASAVGANAITTTAGQGLSLATGPSGVASAGLTVYAASATDTTLNLTLNGYQGGSGVTPIGLTVTGAAATTLNLFSTGAANKVGVTAATFFTGPTTVTTHVVTGDQAVGIVLDAADALKVATVDASAATGSVTYNHQAAVTAVGYKFTGGSGNDTVIFATDQFVTLTAGTQLVGGAGTDKIGLFDTAVTTTEAAKINAATGFEKIGLNAAITLDASSLSNFKTFDIDTTALTQVITGLATGTTINVGHGTGAAFTQTSLTLGGAVGVSDVTIALGATTDTTAHTVTDAVLTGLTNVKIVSNGTAANVFDSDVMVNTDNSSFTITGSAALTMGRIAATTTGSKIDATAATGAITMVGNTTAFATGSALGDILIGGTKADSIKASVNGGTLTGNGGNDTFNVTVALGGITATFNTTSITDFTKGDKIVVTSKGTGVFTTTAVNLSGAASVGAALDLLAAGDGGTNAAIKYGVFQGNTYLVEDLGAGATFAATDIMVKLIGVHDLSTSTFVEATGTITYA